MANISVLRIKAKEILRFRPVISLFQVCNRNYAKVEESEVDEESLSDDMVDAEEAARLQQLQDVSGLPPNYHQQYHGAIVEPSFKDLKRRRKMYMTYGSKSGEDPRILWPRRQEIARMQQEDREEEVPLSEKINQVALERDQMMKESLERQKQIEKNMAQMDKWISQYHSRLDAAEEAVQKRREKKEALLDEAREYFGYRIKANDPKFEQMVEEKEEKERKEAKERKKKEKARKLAERLKQDVLAMKLSSGGENKSGEKSS